MIKNLPATWETWVRSLGQEDTLEKGMAAHSSILAWRISRTEEPGGLQSMGLQRIRHDWATEHAQCFKICFIQPNMWKYCHFSILLKQNINKIAAAAAKSLQSCPTLCDLIDGSPPGSPVPESLGFSRQEHWSGLPFPSPMHESEKWKWSCSVVSNS